MSEIEKRKKSFEYAFKGMKSFLRKEHNAWIHCFILAVVTIAGFICSITPTEWCIIVFCFMAVLAAEAFNTALERVVDLVSPEYNPLAGEAKDIAAAAVLICAVATVIIGLIIFIPYC